MRNLSRKRAMEMLLTGEPIDAANAVEWDLVNKVVPAGELDSEVQRLASLIAAKPPRRPRPASTVISAAFAYDEGRAGMDAFLEKRPPPKY